MNEVFTITPKTTKKDMEQEIERLQALVPSKSEDDTRQVMGRWAMGVLAITVILSMFANGWSNSEGAKEGLSVAAWAYGISIPIIVLGLSQIAGSAYRLGYGWLTKLAGSVTIALLALSIYEVQHAIVAMSGVHWVLATLMAVGIDLSMVVSKLALVVAKK